jgi:hypothetical protein
MSLLDNLPHVCTLTRPDYDQDELGGQIENQTAVTTGIACWVQNASMREIEAYRKVDTEITHKVFFQTDPGFRPGDDLIVTSGPSFVGVEMEFQAGPTDRSAGLGVLFAAMFAEENNPRR